MRPAMTTSAPESACRSTCSVGSPPGNWDETVIGLGGSIFHSSAWAEYQRQTRGVIPWFLLARDESDTPRAATVAFLRQSPNPLAAAIFRDLVVPAHPAALLPDDRRLLVEACEIRAR